MKQSPWKEKGLAPCICQQTSWVAMCSCHQPAEVSSISSSACLQAGGKGGR